jgi:AcrR family transcriptional regulator
MSMDEHKLGKAARKGGSVPGRLRQKDAAENAGRGSRELWLEAAHDLLLENGVASVSIQPLSKKLKLSRTSFYWFFADREELLEALLDNWRNRNTGAIRQQTEAYAETIAEAILNLFDCWLDVRLFDTRLEHAVRSWALQSDIVAGEIERADHTRLEAITSMFTRFGYAAAEADVRARAVYLSQIGYISMQTTEDRDARMRRIPFYVEVFTGKAIQKHELDRFYGRHRYAEQHSARPASGKPARKKAG